jgi:MFS transporter, ACS family, tartrate transporter
LSTVFEDPTLKMIALSIAGFGIFGNLPVFWTYPAAFLSGAAAAGGIALINSIGNLAGFAGPFIMGRVKDVTGSYTGGLLSLSAAGLIAMIVILALPNVHALERARGAGAEGAEPAKGRQQDRTNPTPVPPAAPRR